MFPKHGMPCVVLAGRAQANAVGQRRLQAIEICPDNIYTLVGNQTRQVLSNALPHDARLAVMYSESLFFQNRSGVRGEAGHPTLKILVSGKCQIVGVTGIVGPS
jgi:hypothetical protein